MEPNNDDEWEYIYDETETEAITFLVDFSSAPTKNAKANSTSITTAETENSRETHNASEINAQPSDPASIQFLDLPSRSPYISYKGQVFTGSWGENVGSDLIFASTNNVPPGVNPVIQDKNGKWALLAISQTTLVARPVELIKRTRLGIQPSNDVADAATNSQTSTTARKPFSVVIKPDMDRTARQQAEFLEQFMAVKMAKGENDVVYLGKGVRYIDQDGKEITTTGFGEKDQDLMKENIIDTTTRRKRRRTGDIDDSTIVIDPDLQDNTSAAMTSTHVTEQETSHGNGDLEPPSNVEAEPSRITQVPVDTSRSNDAHAGSIAQNALTGILDGDTANANKGSPMPKKRGRRPGGSKRASLTQGLIG